MEGAECGKFMWLAEQLRKVEWTRPGAEGPHGKALLPERSCKSHLCGTKCDNSLTDALLAQSVARVTSNLEVPGSSPGWGFFCNLFIRKIR